MTRDTIDYETGELLNSAKVFEAGRQAALNEIKEARQKSDKMRARYGELKRGKQRHYYQLSEEKGRNIMRGLSLVDTGALFKLVTSIQFDEEGLIGQRDDGTIKPLKQVELQKLLGKSKAGAKNAIQRLQDVGAVKREGRSFYINEELVTFGKRSAAQKGDQYAKVYKMEVIKLLRRLTDSEAGFFMKCLPYVHYKLHALALNPHEENLKKVEVIRGEKLAEVTGVEIQTVRNLTSKLKKKAAMGFLNIGIGGNGYLVNPNLSDRGFISDYTETVKGLFAAFDNCEEA